MPTSSSAQYSSPQTRPVAATAPVAAGSANLLLVRAATPLPSTLVATAADADPAASPTRPLAAARAAGSTYDGAAAACAAAGGELLTLAARSELAALVSELAGGALYGSDEAAELWVGLHDLLAPGVMQWVGDEEAGGSAAAGACVCQVFHVSLASELHCLIILQSLPQLPNMPCIRER